MHKRAILIGGTYHLTDLRIDKPLEIIKMYDKCIVKSSYTLRDYLEVNLNYKELEYKLCGETPEGLYIYEYVNEGRIK